MAHNFSYNRDSQFSRPQFSRPGHRLHNYRGPYDRIMLEDAKNDLQQTVDSRDSTIWKRIKLKTGIGENGKRDTRYNGFGKPSTTYSYANFPDVEETYSDAQDMDDSVQIYPQKTSTVTSSETMISLEEGECADENNKLDGCVRVTFDSHSDSGIASKNDTSIEGLSLPSSTEKLSQNSEDSAVECEFMNDDTETSLKTCIDVDIESEKINDPTQSNDNDVVVLELNHEGVEILSDGEVSSDIEIVGVSNVTDVDHEDIICLDDIFEQKEDMNAQSTRNEMECTEVLKGQEKQNDMDEENVKKVEMQLANEFDGEFFKCDFCGVCKKDKADLVSHLMTMKHYSASKFESKVKSDKREIIMVEEMSLVNKYGKESMLVICPIQQCNMLFSDLYACTRHLAYKHFRNSICSKKKYGLVKVLQEETCVNPRESLKCEKCNEVFTTSLALSNHYVKKKHYPHVGGGCNQMFTCYYCAYNCNRIHDILKHQELMHKKMVVNGELKYKVVHFLGKQWFYLSENGISTPTTRYITMPNEKTQVKNKTEGDMFYIDRKSSEIGTHDKLGTKDRPVISNQGQSTSKDVNTGNAGEYREDMLIDDVQADAAGPDLAADVSDEENSDIETNQEGSGLLVKYKCDYCPIISDSQGKIMDHLHSAQHASASTLLVSADNKQSFLKDSESSIVCKTIENKTVTAICPEASCRFLFPSIYSCSEHYRMIHDQASRPTYALSNITKSCFIQIPRGPFFCQICPEVFQKQGLLNKHYSKTNHYPFETRDDSEIYFTCIYCKSYENLSFNEIVNHVSLQHKRRKLETYSVQVIYVSKERLKKFLPTFKKDNQGDKEKGEKDVIQMKIGNLQVLLKASVGKQKKGIRSEIRTLRQHMKILKRTEKTTLEYKNKKKYHY